MPSYLLRINSLYEKILSIEQGQRESKIQSVCSILSELQEADSKTGLNVQGLDYVKGLWEKNEEAGAGKTTRP